MWLIAECQELLLLSNTGCITNEVSTGVMFTEMNCMTVLLWLSRWYSRTYLGLASHIDILL